MKTPQLLLINFIFCSILFGQWEKVPLELGNPNAMIEYKGKIYIGGGFKGFYVSEDGGNSWLVMNEGIIANTFETFSFVIFDGLYACTIAGVYKLDEINKKWEKEYLFSAKTMYKNGNLILISNHPKGLVRSVDNGKTWENEKIDEFMNCYSIISFNNYLFCTSISGLFRSDSTGVTWEKINSEHFTKLFIEDSSLNSIQGWRLAKTWDMGYSWIEEEYFYDYLTDYLRIANKKFVCADQNIIYCKTENLDRWRAAIQVLSDQMEPEITKDLFTHDRYIYLCSGNGLWRRLISDFDQPELSLSGLTKDSCKIDDIYAFQFYLSNAGFDTLKISDIVSSNPNFWIIETKYNIPSDYSYGVLVYYYPYNVGEDSTTFTVFSNSKATIENHLFKIYVIPSDYYLSQNFPNPFNAWTEIAYSISKPEFVSVKMYNSLGQFVKNIVSEIQTGGNHICYISSENLASGVYFYRLTSGNFYDVKKMILLK